MAKCMQCGGATKMKKMKMGGTMGIVGMPKYSNDPRTEQGRTLKKGGTVKKMQEGGITSIKKSNKFLKDQKETVVPKRISDLKMSVEEQIKQDKKSKINKYSKGGLLKPVSADKVGLSKLPTAVRNKMGYMKKGGVKKK
jgi:hypothetical protein